jgi:hypothetical protein
MEEYKTGNLGYWFNSFADQPWDGVYAIQVQFLKKPQVHIIISSQAIPILYALQIPKT